MLLLALMNINSFLGLKYIYIYMGGWMAILMTTQSIGFFLLVPILGSWVTLPQRFSMRITLVGIVRSW